MTEETYVDPETGKIVAPPGTKLIAETLWGKAFVEQYFQEDE